MRLPRVLFISAVHPWQYTGLAEYLHRAKLAEVWQMTTPGHHQTYAHKTINLLPFKPTGPIVGTPPNVLRWKLERNTHIAKGIVDAVQQLPETIKPDLIVAHAMWGAPHMLYDTTDIPVVSYVEFPSYRAHGYDAAFPPDPSQRLADPNMEMLTYHQILRSALTIVPSYHAKSMIPAPLRDKIEVQFEGFAPSEPLKPAGGTSQLTVGFAARDLSNPKGIDRFIRTVAFMVEQKQADNLRFVAMGDPNASSYGYEAQHVQRQHDDKAMTYVEHMLRQFPAARCIAFVQKLPYEAYVQKLNEIDIFAYPLRYGVANWGFMEILTRGGCIIGSHDGFLPEILIDRFNGRLAADSPAAWSEVILELANDPAQRKSLAHAARQTGFAYRLDVVARRYLTLFRQAIERGNTY